MYIGICLVLACLAMAWAYKGVYMSWKRDLDIQKRKKEIEEKDSK